MKILIDLITKVFKNRKEEKDNFSNINKASKGIQKNMNPDYKNNSFNAEINEIKNGQLEKSNYDINIPDYNFEFELLDILKNISDKNLFVSGRTSGVKEAYRFLAKNMISNFQSLGYIEISNVYKNKLNKLSIKSLQNELTKNLISHNENNKKELIELCYENIKSNDNYNIYRLTNKGSEFLEFFRKEINEKLELFISDLINLIMLGEHKIAENIIKKYFDDQLIERVTIYDISFFSYTNKIQFENYMKYENTFLLTILDLKTSKKLLSIFRIYCYFKTSISSKSNYYVLNILTNIIAKDNINIKDISKKIFDSLNISMNLEESELSNLLLLMSKRNNVNLDLWNISYDCYKSITDKSKLNIILTNCDSCQIEKNSNTIETIIPYNQMSEFKLPPYSLVCNCHLYPDLVSLRLQKRNR